MASLRREIRTIQALLAGSHWAGDPQTQTVLDEYARFLGTGRLRNRERRTGLQILFASRAFDSLLAHVVRWEDTRPGGGIPGLPRHLTLGGCIRVVCRQGIGGNRFTGPTHTRLDNDLRNQRNRFMHEAGAFPTDAELGTFISDTLAGIQEIVTWR